VTINLISIAPSMLVRSVAPPIVDADARPYNADRSSNWRQPFGKRADHKRKTSRID